MLIATYLNMLAESDMYSRIDEKRSAALVNLQTGSSSLRREGLRPAQVHPSGLEESFHVGGKALVLRPIQADDAHAYAKMIGAGDASSVDYRFPRIRRPLTRAALDRWTRIDYDREMAFVAASTNAGQDALLREVRINVFPGRDAAEFAIFVHPHAGGLGIGRALLKKMICYCSARGFSEIIGQVVAENERMLALARSVGMHIYRAPGAGIAVVYLKLSGSINVANSTTPIHPSATEGATMVSRNPTKASSRSLGRSALGSKRANGRSAYEGIGPQA